jgi:hypothetical protein
MKPKTLGILALVAAALAAFIGLYERRLPSTSERRERAKKAIVFDVTATREVVLEGATPGARLRIEREDAASEESPRVWWIREPLAARADGFAVDRFLQSLAAIEAVRRLDDADRQELGLAQPRFSVTLRGAYGERALEVGSALPVGGTVAVAVRGEAAASIVADTLVADLTKPAADWRSRDLFVANRDEIEGFSIRRGAERLEIERRGEVFAVVAPFADRADRDRVNELFSELASLQASRFLDRASASDGPLGADALVVEVRVKGRQQPLSVEIGRRLAGSSAPMAPSAPAEEGGAAPPETRWVRVDGVAAETETSLAETLSRPVAAWRSAHWSAYEVYRVESLAAVVAGVPWELTRQGSDWKRGDQVLPYGPVSDLLYAVTTAKGAAVLTRAEAQARGVDFEHPQATFRLGGEDGEQESLSLLAALPGGAVPAIASNRDVVLLLSAEAAREIVDKANAVRSAEPRKSGTAEE